MLHWKALTKLSETEHARLDIAAVNLACAADFPDTPSERAVAECLDRLDHYARCAAHYTRERMPEFVRDPGHYDHSEGIFRMVCMITLLQRQFGVVYNPAKIDPNARFYPADTFIHGALLGDGGTCASLPVVYAAVGRRLGYPLKLVSVPRHCLVRWDEPGGERFNIDVGANGVDAPPDDYYRTGRFEVPPEEERQCRFLLSQTRRMELASFLTQAGHRWMDGEQRTHKRATEAFAWAWTLDPGNQLVAECLIRALDDWDRYLARMLPPNFPWFTVGWPPRRFPTLPLRVERQMISNEKIQECLEDPYSKQTWWDPLRRGESPRVPATINVNLPE